MAAQMPMRAAMLDRIHPLRRNTPTDDPETEKEIEDLERA